MTKILVTGANGLLGSALREVMSSENVFLTRDDLDLEDNKSVQRVIADVNPDAIIHCGALVGGVAINLSKPSTFFVSNMRQNLNVIDVAAKLGVPRLVAFVSTCAFPDEVVWPLREELLHKGPPHHSNFGYAYAKRMVEVQIRATNIEFGTAYLAVIPANLYGPNDNFSLNSGHVIPSLIHKAFIAKSRSLEFEVWGSGKQLREFLYSKDLAKVLLDLVKKNSTEPLIVTNGVEVDIGTVAKLIAKRFQIEQQLTFNTSMPEGQLRKPSDPAEFQSLFPRFEFTELEKGLNETIDWFLSNYPHLRV
jgi:GDP-L-fucose synthase